MPTEDGTSEDTSANIGASVEGIHQIYVRCRDLGQAMLADLFAFYHLDFSWYLEYQLDLFLALF